MRISDWSSDVCSSDLVAVVDAAGQLDQAATLEARPVARLGVAKIDAAVLGAAVGDLLGIAQAAAFMGDLGEDMRHAQRRVDLVARQRRQDGIEETVEDRTSVVTGKRWYRSVDQRGTRLLK